MNGPSRGAGPLVVTRDGSTVTVFLRRAGRALVGADPGPEGNVTKLLSAERGQRSLDAAMALLGPQAALAEGYPGEVGRLYIFARQNSIGGGTSEISRNQIGERLLGLSRDPLVN